MKKKTKTENNRMQWEALCAALRAMPKGTLLAIAYVSGSDGHTIFNPDAYKEAGMPADMLAHFTRTYESDTSSPKSTLFSPDGKVMPALQGVYGLTVVETIVSALGLPQSTAMGRGFRARHAVETIAAHCGQGKATR